MREELIKLLDKAYAPYSKFQVACLIEMGDGKYIPGVNVENASYGLANCAERSALFSAITQGYKSEDIKAMLIVADTDAPCSPCGACRQVISELMNRDADIVLTNLKNDIKELKVKDLLPFSFSKDDLNV